MIRTNEFIKTNSNTKLKEKDDKLSNKENKSLNIKDNVILKKNELNKKENSPFTNKKGEEIKKENQMKQYKIEDLMELWKALIDKEYLNDYNYENIIKIQKDINSKMRAILIDWIISIHSYLNLKTNTLFLCISIIDRYLSKKYINRNKLQLLGATALFISSKYEEVNYPHISYFIDFTAHIYTKQQILQMENNILSTINFELNLPFSNYFFEILCILFSFEPNQKKKGSFLLEATLLKMESNYFLQNEIAKSVCYILLKISGKWEYECYESILDLIYFEKEEQFDRVIECSKLVYSMIEDEKRIKMNYKAIYNKYGY